MSCSWPRSGASLPSHAPLPDRISALLVTRAFIGLGEAGYGPAAGAILTSVFPTRMRATIIGGFLAAASFGSVLGVVLGGVIAARWGWKAAFGIVGVPGLVLAGLYMFVRDYKAPELKTDSPAGLHKARGIARELFRARSGIAAYFAGALQLITDFDDPCLAAELLQSRLWRAGRSRRNLGGRRHHLRDGRRRVLVDRCRPACAARHSLAHADAGCMLSRDARRCFATAFGALTPGPLQIGVIICGAFLMGCDHRSRFPRSPSTSSIPR